MNLSEFKVGDLVLRIEGGKATTGEILADVSNMVNQRYLVCYYNDNKYLGTGIHSREEVIEMKQNYTRFTPNKKPGNMTEYVEKLKEEYIKAIYEWDTCKDAAAQKHSHYFKDVSHLDSIDIYRVLYLFNVTDPCLQHAAKKIMVAGNRGYKDIKKDIQEAIDSLNRKLEMLKEDEYKENQDGV